MLQIRHLQNLLFTESGISLINIVLMLISTVVAYLYPFELFLFSYVVLGPLHYLTEISWLDKKQYFLKDKKEVIVFILIGLILLCMYVFPRLGISNYFSILLFTCLTIALASIYFNTYFKKILFTAIVVLPLYIFNFSTNKILYAVFGVMLPTLIHVCLFTGLFILSGAIKSRSLVGTISFIFFIFCIIFIFSNPIQINDYIATKTSQSFYSFFVIIHHFFVYIFNYPQFVNSASIFNDANGLIIMRFIAFSYTFHYLNWFSKTSIIKWHQVDKKVLWLTIFIWLGSLILFYFDMKLGFYALYLLSILHVILEFPLNILTIKQLSTNTMEIFKNKIASS